MSALIEDFSGSAEAQRDFVGILYEALLSLRASGWSG